MAVITVPVWTTITLHTTVAESAAAWASLVTNGGYMVCADADGNLHGVLLRSYGDGW